MMPNSPYSLDNLQAQLGDLSNIIYVTAGGQKAVYDATHAIHGRVALKILPANCHIERLKREIESVQAINNGKVAMVHQVGLLLDPYPGHPWLIEQWIEGPSLREKLNQGRISDALVIKLGSDILATLVEAEKNKIVHRDIKPENIIVSPDESRCWLVDFGIARHLDRTALTNDVMPHTLGYAPIEQLKGITTEIDTRSDLFSLGVTLYECIEGVNPYTHQAKSADEVIQRVMNLTLSPASRKVDKSNQLKDLITSMTMPKRVHRIPTAAEAHEWMNEIAQSGTV